MNSLLFSVPYMIQLKNKISLLLSLIAISLIISGVYFVTAYDEISSQTILQTETTVIGQKIQYPSNSVLITSMIKTIPAGVETGHHTHEFPLFVYVMEGELNIDYKDGINKTFQKGDSFVEAINHLHNGKNIGDKPVKLLVVVLGEK